MLLSMGVNNIKKQQSVLNLIMGIDIIKKFKNVEVLVPFKYCSKNTILSAITTILLW